MEGRRGKSAGIIGVGSAVKLYWMRTSETFPEGSWLETSFTCFDEDKPDRQSDSLWHTYIGGVHQVLAGPEGGLWEWSMAMSLPGPMFSLPRSGTEATRKDAGHRVVECYERMLEFYGRI